MFSHRGNVFGIELQEIGVIMLLDKDIGPVHTAIIYVVIATGFKGDYGLHRLFSAYFLFIKTDSYL